MTWLRATLLGVVAIGLASPAVAEGGGKASNVRITVEVGGLQGGKKVSPKTYAMLAPLRGQTSLSSSARVPIPSTQALPAEAKESQAATVISSFTYQDVGISIDLETTGTDESRIGVHGQVDVSLIRSDTGSKPAPKTPPTIGSFRQKIDVTLQEGKPSRLALVDEPGAEPFYVEIKAEFVE